MYSLTFILEYYTKIENFQRQRLCAFITRLVNRLQTRFVVGDRTL